MDRTVRWLVLAALAGALPLVARSQPIPNGGARAQPPSPRDSCTEAITQPRWLVEPTPNVIWAQYRAALLGVEAKAVKQDVRLLCTVDLDTGRLFNCRATNH